MNSRMNKIHTPLRWAGGKRWVSSNLLDPFGINIATTASLSHSVEA